MSENDQRRRWTAVEKLRIVLAGMQPGVEVSELCRREGLNLTLYYGWKKKLLSSASKVFDDQDGRRSAQAGLSQMDAIWGIGCDSSGQVTPRRNDCNDVPPKKRRRQPLRLAPPRGRCRPDRPGAFGDGGGATQARVTTRRRLARPLAAGGREGCRP